MTTPAKLSEAVRAAWAAIPAPPAEDLQYMAWGWGEEAALAFIDIDPVDVDITSDGFYAATPLLDLPARAAAAYLGTFIMALLRSLETQQALGLYYDVPTRAHTITCLTSAHFWERVIRPHLPPECRKVLVEVATYLASEKDALSLTDEQVNRMLSLVAAH